MTRSDQSMPSRFFIFCLLLSALLLLCRPSAAGQPKPLQNPKSIIVVSDDNYPPYIFRDAKGNLQGILVDEWGLWENKTGIKVDLRGMDWGKARKIMAEGKADVIDTIFFTDERAKQYDFSQPYATLEVPIFFHKNISGITDSNSLHGFVVGVKDGDACIDMLQRAGISTLKTYHNYEHIVQAAADRDISVFCMDKPPALYYLYKFNIEKEYRQSRPLYSGKFHRAVKKGRTDLLGVVEGGFSKITGREHEEIEKKWMGTILHADPAVVRNIIYSLAGIGAIALLLVLWNLLLRKRVASRTAELMASMAELRKKGHDLVLSERKFATLFLASPIGIVISTLRDDRYLEVNDAYLEMSGYSHGELINRSALELGIWVDPEDREKMLAALRERRKVENQETHFRTKAGKVLDVLRTAEMIDYGDEPCMISATRDISELKIVERNLQRSKEFIETIFNSMDDAIAIVDVHDLTIVDANRVFVEKSGLPKAELVGKKCHEITHRSGGPCVVHGEACPISTMMASRSAATLEHCHELPGGQKEFIEVTAAPISDDEGNIVKAVYITRDITERKLAEENIRNSEERYRSLFDSTLDGVYRVNAEGVFTQINPAGARIFGYESPEEIIGRNTLEYWRDLRDRDAYRAELKLKKSVSAYHMAAKKCDGRLIDLETTSRIIEDHEGNYLGITGILRDVTERKLLEAEQKKLVQLLRSALAEVRTLTGMLPICSSCKKIRDDKGYWSQIESYISEHSEAEFTHGICPECEKKVYEELDKLTKGKP